MRVTLSTPFQRRFTGGVFLPYAISILDVICGTGNFDVLDEADKAIVLQAQTFPAFVGLALDIGLARLPLSVQRVEFLARGLFRCFSVCR